MKTSTRLLSVALMACSLAAGMGSTATAAPAPSGAATFVEVRSAKLQADGSVLLRLGLNCPVGSTYVLSVNFSQAFQGNGRQYDAVAYVENAATGNCSGRRQKLLVSTGPSQRAAFIRDVGATRENPPRLAPTTAGAYLNVTSATGELTSASGEGVITLR